MNSTIEFIGKKFGVDVNGEQPVVLKQINRTIVVEMFAELGFKTGLEMGVAEGIFANLMLDKIPGLKLYCVDAWKHYPGYNEYKNIGEVYEEAKERLSGQNCEIVRKFSMDAAADFEDSSLDFVFIDGGHDFRNVASDVYEWSKKVRPGGIIFGHDYKFHQEFIQKTPGHYARLRHAIEVKPAVDAYILAKGIRPWFVMHPHIPDPTFGPDNPCWMFVRQDGDKI